MTVGKFKVMKVDDHSVPNHLMKDIELQAVYDETLPEDQRFAVATPVGKVTMMITTPGIEEHFPPNESVFCVFMSDEEYRNFEVERSQPAVV